MESGPLVLSALAFVLILLGLGLIYRSGSISAFIKSSLGLILVGAAIVVFLVALQLHAFALVDFEEKIADVRINQSENDRFTLTLELVGNEPKTYSMTGQQWQLDARVLVWDGWLKWLGKQPLYQLDRLSGRYDRIADETLQPRTLYSLRDESAAFDAWAIAAKHPDWFPGLTTKYGSSVYVPMAEGLRYSVYLHAKGLIVRPSDERTSRALNEWK